MADPQLLDDRDRESSSSNSSQSGDHVEVTIETRAHPALETGLPPSPPSPEDTLDGGRNHGTFARALRAGLLKKNQDYVRIKISRARSGGAGGQSRGRGILAQSSEPLPHEWWKTGVAFVYACSCLVLTTGVITMVHERVPSQMPPLPDKFFDLIPRMPGAFHVTEINGMLLVGLFLMQWLFLKHRAIIIRRFFFLQGTLYLYRCVTMYLTVLPPPGSHLNCAPKLYGDAQGKVYRMLKMVSGGGLSITGSHIMCGDYLYSGHTVMLTLTFLFIREYSPRSMWWYHLICWLLSAVGLVCILLAHDHYSIDVVVAYFITTRIFYWYHTMANNKAMRGSPHNYLSNTWWNPIFNFLEQNVRMTVPCTFAWPIPIPTSWFENPCRRYSMVQSTRGE
ncbi:phosphatidylcholine:ceramide cholinephosphotransferase 2-like [Alosa pseudoharengus]|uniref:phosphatidylcholine:ceramide cholinephosphotransferase 2-like n=1 Tax=Alosa pseudoharengus TaxID=34774 RepID=UPI003F8B8D58